MRGVQYHAFVDPSGGRSDSMTLAVGHGEGREYGVIDVIREVRPPFDPASAVAELVGTLLAYNIREVSGDKYGGEWPPAEFRRHGVWYRSAEKAKSDIYRELLPAVNARRVELLDVPKLVAQLVGLERRVGRGGRDSIDHAPGAHDDVANAVAGVCEVVLGKVRYPGLQQARLWGV